MDPLAALPLLSLVSFVALRELCELSVWEGEWKGE